MRLESESAENPAKITECTAPRRTIASMVTMASGIIGMYTATRSPDFTPSSMSALAALGDHLLEFGVGDGARLAFGVGDPVVGDLVALPASTCRSTQLYDAFSVPSLNHLAKGRSHSRVLVGSFVHVSRSACVRQYASGQRPLRRRSKVARSPAANSALGGKLRVSSNHASSLASLMTYLRSNVERTCLTSRSVA